MSETSSGAQPSAGGGGPPPKGPWYKVITLIRWEYVLVGMVLLLIGAAVLFDSAVIRRLTDTPFARGLITFIISVATIGLAFVLVCESFSTTQDDKLFDERFRRARECA